MGTSHIPCFAYYFIEHILTFLILFPLWLCSILMQKHILIYSTGSFKRKISSFSSFTNKNNECHCAHITLCAHALTHLLDKFLDVEFVGQGIVNSHGCFQSSPWKRFIDKFLPVFLSLKSNTVSFKLVTVHGDTAGSLLGARIPKVGQSAKGSSFLLFRLFSPLPNLSLHVSFILLIPRGY